MSNSMMITIYVDGGVVYDVHGLPEGWEYQVFDEDVCSDCGGIKPLCGWCLQYEDEE